MNSAAQVLPRGPLMIGLPGPELSDEDRALLCDPAVGGVILFERNYRSPRQMRALAGQLRALREPQLLLGVDQEGGRVQRFRAGLTALPAIDVLGRWYAQQPDRACDLAYRHGRVMAAELLDLGIDLSFAPVLDLGRGSTVIGDRAMAGEPTAVARLGAYYIAGMNDAGMAACGKHFPGHGSVLADSHHEVVTDPRSADQLAEDLCPFEALAPKLGAIMMAHVCYPAIDPQPAGFSSVWIGQRLRDRLGYHGAIVSDDLDMIGASMAGDLGERVERALSAGCDLVLVCRPESARDLIARAERNWPAPPAQRLERLQGRAMASLQEQLTVPEFRAWRDSLERLI